MTFRRARRRVLRAPRRASGRRELHVTIHEEDGAYWAEIAELPGCFASGDDLEELREALFEAVQMYLSPDDAPEPTNGGSRPLRVGSMTLVAR